MQNTDHWFESNTFRHATIFRSVRERTATPTAGGDYYPNNALHLSGEFCDAKVEIQGQHWETRQGISSERTLVRCIPLVSEF